MGFVGFVGFPGFPINQTLVEIEKLNWTFSIDPVSYPTLGIVLAFEGKTMNLVSKAKMERIAIAGYDPRWIEFPDATLAWWVDGDENYGIAIYWPLGPEKGQRRVCFRRGEAESAIKWAFRDTFRSIENPIDRALAVANACGREQASFPAVHTGKPVRVVAGCDRSGYCCPDEIYPSIPDAIPTAARFWRGHGVDRLYTVFFTGIES